jgi:hypothetical protein
MLMSAFVMVLWALLTSRAGAWGVPYFSFETERGSSCTNNLTGYTCQPVTLADVQFYGDVTLPADTLVVKSRYHATHDFQIEASLLAPAKSAPAALAGLHESFGPCQANHPAPMPTAGLTGVCVLANDDATITRDSDTSSRLYVVGTALRADGSRLIVMTIQSR